MKEIIIAGVLAFSTKIIITLFAEPMVSWVFFGTAKWLAKLTPTKVDDKFVNKLETEYKKRNQQ